MATFNCDGLYHAKPVGPHVLYLRQSNRPRSKLDIDKQRSDAASLIATGRGRIIAEFIEVEPLVGGQRPQLEAAVAFCKSHPYPKKLMLGKINGMRDGVRWLQYLHDEEVKFIGADQPEINLRNWRCRMRDRELRHQNKASTNIKRALRHAKANGVTLGGKRENSNGLTLGPAASAKARKRTADSKASSTLYYIEIIQRQGVTTLNGIATRLNQMKHPTPRGGKWSASQVRAAFKRFER